MKMRVPFQIILQRNWLSKRHKIIKHGRNFSEGGQLFDYKSLKVLFFGTDTFSLPSLKLLHNEWYKNHLCYLFFEKLIHLFLIGRIKETYKRWTWLHHFGQSIIR